jgi:hypothetical protein
MRSFIIVHFSKYGVQVEEGEMNGACNTHGTDEKCLQNFGQNLKGRDHH